MGHIGRATTNATYSMILPENGQSTSNCFLNPQNQLFLVLGFLIGVCEHGGIGVAVVRLYLCWYVWRGRGGAIYP